MITNLLYNHVPIDQGIAEHESELIKVLCPALNITNPSNAHSHFIKRLRAVCQVEAARDL
jgi:hypothetical protein